MQILQVNYNVATKSWSDLNFGTVHDDSSLHLQFSSEEEVTVFHNLRFGFELYETKDRPLNSPIQQENHPATGIQYLQSKSVPLLCAPLLIEENKEYTLRIWASNNFEFSETETNFTVKKTPSQETLDDNPIKTP